MLLPHILPFWRRFSRFYVQRRCHLIYLYILRTQQTLLILWAIWIRCYWCWPKLTVWRIHHSMLSFLGFLAETEEKFFSLINILLRFWFFILPLPWTHHLIVLFRFDFWDMFVMLMMIFIFRLVQFMFHIFLLMSADTSILLLLLAHWKTSLTILWFIFRSFYLFILIFFAWIIQLFCDLFEWFHFIQFFILSRWVFKSCLHVVIILRVKLKLFFLCILGWVKRQRNLDR